MDYYRVPEYSRKEIIMMNNIKLTDAQTVYLVSRMFDNADLVDICKDVNKNQEEFAICHLNFLYLFERDMYHVRVLYLIDILCRLKTASVCV